MASFPPPSTDSSSPVVVNIPPGPVFAYQVQEEVSQVTLVVVYPTQRAVGLLTFARRDYPIRLWHQCELGLAIPPSTSGETLTGILESEEGQRLLGLLLGHYLGEIMNREGVCQGQWAMGFGGCVDELEGLLGRV